MRGRDEEGWIAAAPSHGEDALAVSLQDVVVLRVFRVKDHRHAVSERTVPEADGGRKAVPGGRARAAHRPVCGAN